MLGVFAIAYRRERRIAEKLERLRAKRATAAGAPPPAGAPPTEPTGRALPRGTDSSEDSAEIAEESAEAGFATPRAQARRGTYHGPPVPQSPCPPHTATTTTQVFPRGPSCEIAPDGDGRRSSVQSSPSADGYYADPLLLTVGGGNFLGSLSNVRHMASSSSLVSPWRGARDTWQDRGLLHDYFAEPEDATEGTERRGARGPFGAFFQGAGLSEPMLRPTAASEGGVLPLPPLTPDVTRSTAESAGSATKPRGRSRSIS